MNMQQNELDILQTILKPFCDKQICFMILIHIIINFVYSPEILLKQRKP